MKTLNRRPVRLLAFPLVATAAVHASWISAEPNRDWPNFGNDTDETHYSAADQVNRTNVSRLGLVWSADLNTTPTNTAPLAVNGVIYVAAGYSIVHAFDAKSGKPLWTYDPQAAEAAGEKLRYAWGIRGLAYADGQLVVGTIDGRLIALNSATGKLNWSVQTVDPDDALNITGVPRIMGDKVIIGNGGADMAAVRGYVTAYDLKTGAQAWRFYTVPGGPGLNDDPAMALAAQTWSGNALLEGGGGTVWSGITYDEEFDQVYIGVGNGGPWNWKIRNPEGKDNLFLSSIVALNAKTGKYVWHYQTNPNDAWDYSAAMEMTLATLQIEGKRRKVLMQAPKNGFLYVIDRGSGELISAEKIVKVTWADRIDLETGRPVEREGIRYETASTYMWPSYYGGHNWQPQAFSPQTGWLYIPVLEMPATWSDDGVNPRQWVRIDGTINTGLSAPVGVPGEVRPQDISKLIAWDPVLQREIWAVRTTDGQNPGVMATAGGVVFQGETNATFNAYDAEFGRLLWSYPTKIAVTGSPITFTVDGKQYIAVITSPPVGPQSTLARRAGWTWNYREHARRLLVFALDGTATIPETPEHGPVTPLGNNEQLDPALVTKGEVLFGTYACRACHGSAAISGGGAPDLRAAASTADSGVFRSIVRDGILVPRGMPKYPEFSDDQVEALRQYLRFRAQEDFALGRAVKPSEDSSN